MAVTPLVTAQAFLGTPYADVAANLQANDLERTMLRATRRAETLTGGLLASFTTTDDVRLSDSDQDGSMLRPGIGDIGQQIAADFARSRGPLDSVRHFWVTEAPRANADLWSGSLTSITVRWPDSPTPFAVPVASTQFFDSIGYGRFAVGQLIPQGSMASITYTGGYATCPEDLEEAIIALAASMVIRALDPMNASTTHDPDQLLNYAKDALRPYAKPGSQIDVL